MPLSYFDFLEHHQLTLFVKNLLKSIQFLSDNISKSFQDTQSWHKWARMFNGSNHYHEHLCSFGLSIAHQQSANPHQSFNSSIWCFRLINLIPLICSKGNLCLIYIAYLPKDLKIKIFSSIKNLPFIFCKILFLLWFWLRLVFIILIYFWILFHDFSPACFIFPNFFIFVYH